MFSDDTICAIATGNTGSGIGIIRVSGDRSIEICDRIFVGKKRISEMKTYTAAYGHIVDRTMAGLNGETDGGSSEQKIIDEVIVLVMKAPHSYTTEDTVEINCHGGVFLMKRVLSLLIKNGVRIAEPGEFTKRAYMGGRIDMSEAEAVMDVINAESDRALGTSVRQLRGQLKDKIASLRERILYDTAYIESAIDDPENYSLDGFGDKLRANTDELINEAETMLRTFDEGRLVKEGIRTAIIGKPNAGKSSVLNMLLMEERAIVTDVEGTTRDTLEEYASLSGILLRLIDTAGIRETTDKVERIGIERAEDNIRLADLVLFVVDGTRPLDDNDRRIAGSLAGKKVITLINKEDLPIVISREEIVGLMKEEDCVKEPYILTISAKEERGREELADLIKNIFLSGEAAGNDQLIISNERHKNALYDALCALKRVRESIDKGLPEDFYTIDLMAAYESLGLITGETLADDLADKIFAEFCMGK